MAPGLDSFPFWLCNRRAADPSPRRSSARNWLLKAPLGFFCCPQFFLAEGSVYILQPSRVRVLSSTRLPSGLCLFVQSVMLAFEIACRFSFVWLSFLYLSWNPLETQTHLCTINFPILFLWGLKIEFVNAYYSFIILWRGFFFFFFFFNLWLNFKYLAFHENQYFLCLFFCGLGRVCKHLTASTTTYSILFFLFNIEYESSSSVQVLSQNKIFRNYWKKMRQLVVQNYSKLWYSRKNLLVN